jgi:hypothetical protein
LAYSNILEKIRALALGNAQLQIDLGSTQPPPAVPFRWFDRQLAPGIVADRVAGGTCVTAMRVSTLRGTNQGGIMDLENARIQINVYDLDSNVAADVANDVVEFMGTITLCSAINQNPARLLDQRQGMVVNPQSKSGPIYTEILDFRLFNRTDLS